jgi:membrane associated rhomboid family serine protease
MIPLRDMQVRQVTPVVTWALALLNVAVYLWDRGGNLGAPGTAFADLALRPYELTSFLTGHGDPVAALKVFTSMFLHGNLWHLVGNLVFLCVFGPAVEEALGGPAYGGLYVLAGLAAAAAHVFVNSGDFAPLTGASGAIGGVLGAYFVLFPAARIQVWALFDTFPVAAWLMLSVWFVAQVFLPQQGVANWAHVGGFVAGMAWILARGGRDRVLKPTPTIEADEATP